MNAAPSTPVTHLFVRDGDGSGNGLSTGSIIAIVVVCACVGILVLALFLWRLLIRFCRPNHPAPLPPVQELAHRREQQLAALAEQRMENRPTTWLDDSFNSRGSQMLYQASSAQSLLPQGTPERKSSIQTDGDEGATAESMSPLPSPVPMEPPLHPPNPAFFGSSGWDSSNSSPNNSPRDSFIGASGSPGIEPAPSPSPSVPFSSSSSSGSHITAAGSQPFQSSSSHATYPRQMRSRSNYRTDAQGRRLSQVLSVGTNWSSPGFRSTSVIRGAPHSRHSTVQIVLPAPLGPHSPMEGYGNQEARRSSIMADQWVMAGSREGSVDSGSRERSRSRHGDRRPSSQPAPRNKPYQSSSSEALPMVSERSQRSLSQPRPSYSRPHAYIPPPIPRIPEAYTAPDFNPATLIPERGRSPLPKPMAAALPLHQAYNASPERELPPTPPSPSPQERPHRKLHKQRDPVQ